MSDGGSFTLSRDSEKDISEKRKLVTVKVIVESDLPYRVIRKSNGVTLASFSSLEQISDFLEQVSLKTLKPIFTRKYIKR